MSDSDPRPETPGGYNLSDSFGYWINRLSRTMRDEVDRDFAAEGVNVAHWAILSACEEGGANQRIVDIARRIGVDAAGITRLIDRLGDMGLVERHSDPLDRRAQAIVLTGKGRALLPRLREISARHNDWWMRELGIEAPAELVDRMRRAVERAEAGAGPRRRGPDT